MEKLEKFLSKYGWFWVLMLSAPAVLALLVPGFFGASDDMHIAWLYEMDKVLRIGQFPPRFVPDLSFGFGYPLFNFVFPLPFYIAEIFHLIGLNLVDSIKAVFFISLPVSAFFMYFFLRQVTTPLLSLFGALIYLYTPYRATDIYIRGAFGESLTFIFLPLIALSVVKLTTFTKRLNYRWIAIGGLSLGSLVLTHNITAYMFLPFIFLLGLVRIFYQKERSLIIVNGISAGLLGLIVSSYFWVPALFESSLMKYDTVFNFVDHFPTLRQLFLPYWGYGGSVPGPGDGMSFYLGVFNVLLVFGSVFAFIKRRKYSIDQKILLSWAFVSFWVAVFLMNFRSVIVWQNIPLIPYFQFPWRFLIITTFVTPLMVVALDQVKIKNYLALIGTAVLLVISFNYFHPQDFLGRTDSYYLNRYIPIPFASIEYLKTQEEYLRLSVNTIKRPEGNAPQFEFDGTVEKVVESSSLKLVVEVSAEQPQEFVYNKYYFPGWVVLVDGKEAQIQPKLPFGQISLMIPKGDHTVKVVYSEPGYKRGIDLLSLVGLSIGLLLLVRSKVKYNKDNEF